MLADSLGINKISACAVWYNLITLLYLQYMKCHNCKIQQKKINQPVKMAQRNIWLCRDCYKIDATYFIRLEQKPIKKRRKSYLVNHYLRNIIFALYPYACMACCAQSKGLNVDHIIAKSKGGTDELANLQILCWLCNRTKANKVFVDYRCHQFLEFKQRGISLAHLLKIT